MNENRSVKSERLKGYYKRLLAGVNTNHALLYRKVLNKSGLFEVSPINCT
jgi:hypothetical protein